MLTSEIQFNPAGLGILLIILAIASLQIVCHHWIKKITNYYFLWLGIAIFYLSWLIAFRFAPSWIQWINANPPLDPTIKDDSKIISISLIMDVCSFTGVSMCLALMLDPSRKIARAFASIAILSSTFILFALPGYKDAQFTANYIFFGSEGKPLYVFLHAMNFLLGIGIYLNTSKFGWKGFLTSLGAIVFIYIYVLIASRVSGCMWGVSGLRWNDWSPEGEYRFVAIILNVDYHAAPFIAAPLALAAGSGLVALHDYGFGNLNWFRYGNGKSDKWYHWYNYNKHVKQIIC